MKRFVCFLLVLVLFSSVLSVSFADYPLTENEQKFVGSWAMYANNGKGTIYSFLITFLDNGNVVQKSLIFKNGVLSSDNKASGEWLGFTDNTIIFSLAGTDMTAMIKEDGYLYLYFYKDLSMCGIFAKCVDMTDILGW